MSTKRRFAVSGHTPWGRQKKRERNWEHDRVLCAVGKELSPFIPLICIRLVVRPESYLKFPLGCVVRKFDWDGASGWLALPCTSWHLGSRAMVPVERRTLLRPSFSLSFPGAVEERMRGLSQNKRRCTLFELVDIFGRHKVFRHSGFVGVIRK